MAQVKLKGIKSYEAIGSQVQAFGYRGVVIENNEVLLEVSDDLLAGEIEAGRVVAPEVAPKVAPKAK